MNDHHPKTPTQPATPPHARTPKATRQQPAWRYRGTACARPWVRERHDRWPRPRRARRSGARGTQGWRPDDRGRPPQDHGDWAEGDRGRRVSPLSGHSAFRAGHTSVIAWAYLLPRNGTKPIGQSRPMSDDTLGSTVGPFRRMLSATPFT